MLFLIILIVGIIAFIVYSIIYAKYESFVVEHSVLLQDVRKLNTRYHFNKIDVFNYKKEYDNEHYYNNVSSLDYLTYQLQFIQKDVKNNISKVIENANGYDLYVADLKEITCFDKYDVEVTLSFKNLLLNIEHKLYEKNILHPVINFNISVEIVLTDINGKFKRNKRQVFGIEKIEDVIYRLNDKYNNRFNDETIWKSISAVERAKVSNKMRFAVYKRDNNRCVKCGSRSNLEVDHIMPIAKGGKTEFNNLQTLCKKCNERKSDIIEVYSYKTFDPNKRYCAKCKAPLKLINGKYGKFYGCSNYPRCEYKEKYLE